MSWVYNTQTGQPVQEQSATASIPPPNSIAVVGPDTIPAFASQYHDWLFQPTITTTGSYQVTVTFGDGTTGNIPDIIYDGWGATCATGLVEPPESPGVAYVNGALSLETDQAHSDIWLDCAGGNVIFPHGATLVANPQADAWNNLTPNMGNVLGAATNVPSGPTTIALTSFTLGAVYVANLGDGGQAKIMPLSNDPTAVPYSISGMSLHANVAGSYAF